MVMCIHDKKELEYQLNKKRRIESSALWRIFYKFDDRLALIADKISDKKVKLLLLLSFLFAFGDSFTTHLFLTLGLGEEGNLIPARFFAAGLRTEFEILKWLAVTFIFMFNYTMATRGWTSEERNGGKVGLLTSSSIFAGVVCWNILMMFHSLIFG